MRQQQNGLACACTDEWTRARTARRGVSPEIDARTSSLVGFTRNATNNFVCRQSGTVCRVVLRECECSVKVKVYRCPASHQSQGSRSGKVPRTHLMAAPSRCLVIRGHYTIVYIWGTDAACRVFAEKPPATYSHRTAQQASWTPGRTRRLEQSYAVNAAVCMDGILSSRTS